MTAVDLPFPAAAAPPLHVPVVGSVDAPLRAATRVRLLTSN